MKEAGTGRAVENARLALDRGDLFRAYEHVAQAREDEEATPALDYLEVLILARMGDFVQAARRFDEHRLAETGGSDIDALRARLLKDQAFAAEGDAADRLLHDAGEAYAAAWERHRDYFPLINAASLARLAGDTVKARERAEAVLAHPMVAAAADYWASASRAEALLILERRDEAQAELARAAALPDATPGARSTTLRQLERLLAKTGDDVEKLLAPLRPGPVAFFCGHMFRSDSRAEALLADRIDEALAARAILIGYGALAAGADILIAERLLARGGELHVVLPFCTADFRAHSVLPAGPEWEPRFDACIARAASVTHASVMDWVGDDGQFAYGSRVAMGMARLRAAQIRAGAVQLAVWDGRPAGGPAGTGADIALWDGVGGERVAIAPGAVDRALGRPATPAPAHQRALRAIIFTDFPGFSRLPEAALPHFWREVMDRSADVLERHGAEILCQNSWGDSIYLIVSDAPAAAEIVLELQEALQGMDLSSMGLEGGVSMRLAAHFGPMYETWDRILDRVNFYGTEVSRAARLEPVTPPGSIYVTEPFAAVLETSGGGYRMNYVGRIDLAKKYGSFPIYRLERGGRQVTP